MRLTSAAEQRSHGVSTAVATSLGAFALAAGTTASPSTIGVSIGHLTMVGAAGLLALRARRRTIVTVGSIAGVAASMMLASQHGLVTAAITALLVAVLTLTAAAWPIGSAAPPLLRATVQPDRTEARRLASWRMICWPSKPPSSKRPG